MRRKLTALAAAGLMVMAGVTACDDSDDSSDSGGTSGGSGKARVGVILPDLTTSQRWKTDDPKFLKEAFAAAGVPVEIQNAQGDKAQFERIGDQMINSGVKVLVIVNLDSTSGRAVLQKARQRKIRTIDYDRLTLNGGAEYYVSFNNEQVGQQLGNGLVKCLQQKRVANPVVAELNGSPTDNNATLFKTGYDAVLQPRYDEAAFTKGPDQSVPDWNNDAAGQIFDQMLSQQPSIDGVLAANDGLANSVIKVLRKKGLAGKVAVTGQDATVQGLQNVLSGEQCITIYKRIKPEAQSAANLAIQLFKGQTPDVSGPKIKDPESGLLVPFVGLEPQSIDADAVKDVVADGFVTTKELCVGRYAALCTRHGVK